MRGLKSDPAAAPGGPQAEAEQAPDEQQASRRLPGWLVVGLPALVELVVGGYRISGPSFWRDEAYTITGSQRPVSSILAMIPHEDAFHGLYLLLDASRYRARGHLGDGPAAAVADRDVRSRRPDRRARPAAGQGVGAARRVRDRPDRRAAAGGTSADHQVRAGGQAVCPDRAVRGARDLPAGRGRYPARLALVVPVCRRPGRHRVLRPGRRAADRGARHQPAGGAAGRAEGRRSACGRRPVSGRRSAGDRDDLRRRAQALADSLRGGRDRAQPGRHPQLPAEGPAGLGAAAALVGRRDAAERIRRDDGADRGGRRARGARLPRRLAASATVAG